MKEMARTQLYLTREELEALDRLREETGVSQSELVRRAIDRLYLGRERLTREQRLEMVRAAAGAWTDRGETGAEYVERLRSGRLGRLRSRAE